MYDPNFASWLRYNSDKRCCTDYLRNGSRSFYAASKLLPSMYRIPMTALYAFCRVADDEIDVAKGGYDVLALLHTRLKRIYEGDPRNDPVDRAFSDVAYSYAIPMTIPMALFEGFTWDIDNRDYNTLSDVYAYSARVAGTVGTMMALIMDVKDRELLSRACDLGIAMQLTNIARDVGEDAEQGRLYLPRELLMAEGIDPDAWLRDPQFCPEVGNVVKVLLDAADDMYQRADWGLSRLPSGCRPAMFCCKTDLFGNWSGDS